MIYESSYWKDDLFEQANSLRNRLQQKRWLEKSFARIEQTVMLGFYSIRKLIEAKKLSDAVVSHKLTVVSYPWLGKPVHFNNTDKIDILYDLEKPINVEKELQFLCNQFIHSYIFLLELDEQKILRGVYISSDRERCKSLYFIEIKQIIDLFELVGNSYPSNIRIIYNSKKDDYDIKAW